MPKANISKIDLFLLGLLEEQPMYGYQINELIEEWQVRRWARISFSSIYYSLNKLDQRGLVRKEENLKGPVQQNVYHITDRGRRVFLRRLKEELGSEESAYIEYNIGLTFVNHLEPAEVIACLEKRKGYIEDMVARVKTLQERWRDQERYYAPLDHGLAFYQNELEWLDKYIQELSADASLKKPGSKSYPLKTT